MNLLGIIWAGKCGCHMAFFKFTKSGSHVAIFATIFVVAMAASFASWAASFEQQGDVGFVDADTVKSSCE